MPEYTVKDTHIKHGKKGETAARLYGPGENITLTEEEAERLGRSIEPAGKTAPDAVLSELVNAARTAIAEGQTTQDGKPEVKAMEQILGRNISASDRDTAWEKIQAEDNG